MTALREIRARLGRRPPWPRVPTWGTSRELQWYVKCTLEDSATWADDRWNTRRPVLARAHPSSRGTTGPDGPPARSRRPQRPASDIASRRRYAACAHGARPVAPACTRRGARRYRAAASAPRRTPGNDAGGRGTPGSGSLLRRRRLPSRRREGRRVRVPLRWPASWSRRRSWTG